MQTSNEIIDRAAWEAINAWRKSADERLVRVVNLIGLKYVMIEEIVRAASFVLARDEFQKTGDESVLLTNLKPITRDAIEVILPKKES